MTPDDRVDHLDRLESTLGTLLNAGVLSAAACLAVGLGIWMAMGATPAANGALTTGLIILMVTPILRVAVSFVAYARMGDWFFVATTISVFVTLILAWMLKS